jgi:polysaccharide deacetylase 2 family uncharacterized protein YibQ
MVRQKQSGKFPGFIAVLFLLIVALGVFGIITMHKTRLSPGVTLPKPKSVPPGKTVKKIAAPVVPKKIRKAGAVPQTGVIAVVLDDWGYNRSHCRSLAKIKAPIGVAILPGLTYSKDVIACALASGHEPMLHLPFEPHRSKEMYTEDYLLTSDESNEQTKKRLDMILSEMKGVVGVNNHTGSKGTENPELVKLVLTELKRRKLFFVDSVTTPNSVCGTVAANLKMRIGRRDVFLDNKNERSEIERQFSRAANIAEDTGRVLVIGHDRVLTLQILLEQISKLEARGLRFIPVSEYIRKYEYTRN